MKTAKQKQMKNWKKIFYLFLCLMFLAPIISQAQLTSVPISSDQIGEPVEEDGSVASSIARGLGLGSYLDAFNSAMSKINKIQCYSEVAQKALNVAEKVDQWSFGGLKLLTGDAGEAAMIKSKITALEGAKGCTEGKLKDIKKTQIATLTQGQLRQSLIQQYTTELATIQKRLDELNVQYRNATRSLWKAVLTKTLLATTKAVAAKLVNSLSYKFKISNYLSYADAVAGNVYAAQLINSNIKDGKDQLIARSLLTDPVVQNQVQPAIFQRANTALGFNPDDLDLTDANFYQKSFQVGSGNTNAFLMQVQALDNADQIKAQSLTSAKTEISLGNGLKAPKTCDGSIAAQAAIDAEYKAVNNEIQNRTKLLQDLQNYRTVARNLTSAEAQQLDADIKKAEKDFNNAGQKLNDLPKKYKSPVVQICKDITSPASLVNMGINEAFSSFAGKMSDYNDNNLPFFVNFISDIGTQIGTSLIFGGNTGSTLLNESGNLAQAASLGIKFAKNEQAQSNLAKGIRFDYEKSDSFADAYTLSWDVLEVKDADYVTIKGTGISDTQKFTKLSDSVEIRTSASNTYLLKVFDKTGKMLTSASLDLEVEAANPYLGGSSGPMVRGASISKIRIPIRGPIGISPRGSY